MLRTKFFRLGQIIIMLSLIFPVLLADKIKTDPVIKANTKFAIKIMKEIYANNDQNSLNFSPFSLNLALAVTSNGAEGRTRDEMLKILEYQDLDLNEVNRSNKIAVDLLNETLPEIKLNIAQSIWVDHQLKLKEEFLEMNKGSYLADLMYLDLRDPLAPDFMNRWIFENTDNQIFSMVDNIDPDIIMYLLSTIYFKGKWAVQFKKEYSQPHMFISRDRSEKELIFMKTKSDEISFIEEKGFKAIGLPYGNGDISMYFFLPDETSHIDLFIQNLNSVNWENWMEGFTTQEVVVVIPRVKLDSDITFNTILQKIGIKKAFTEQADFSGMIEGKAFISEVKQKSFIEFTEQGTEAAAADIVVFKKGGCEHIYFYRPFFYSLVDNRTGTILMMGVYQG